LTTKTDSKARTLIRLFSSSSDSDNSNAASADPSTSGQTLYQRIFYMFTPGSDVERHNGLVLEERIRFRTVAASSAPAPAAASAVWDERNVVPYGHRTLIWRDGNVEDGEIGDAWFEMDVHSHADRNKMHHDGSIGGKHLESQVATALYLAHCPSLVERGKALQVACDDGLAGLLGAIGAGLLLRKPHSEGAQPARNDTDASILTVPTHEDLLPPDLEVLLLTDSDDGNLDRVGDHIHNAGINDKKIVVSKLDWTDRIPYRPGMLQREDFAAIVASDVVVTYPEAKELARTVAHRLEPSYPYLTARASPPDIGGPPGSAPFPRFVHVCPEDRPDLSYLHRLLEKGYKMNVGTGYLKLDKLVFKYQALPSSAPEAALDDLELELAHEAQSTYLSLVAHHHLDYAGEGSGEWFFPMETGEYDGSTSSSAGTYLERETKGPW
jgi:hypothetical protein